MDQVSKKKEETSASSSSQWNKKEKNQLEEEELECAVCLQTCIHPVRLPCSHIFCFLCVKGVANQSKRCAMCRQEIPADFLERPFLLKKVEETEHEVEGYQWFYEGRNGWWQYDGRTNEEIENLYAVDNYTVKTIMIAGCLYNIDFMNMKQYKQSDPSRKRNIKRDLKSSQTKGVAGLSNKVLTKSQGQQVKKRGRKRKNNNNEA